MNAQLGEIFLRFLIGGTVITGFAVLGDLFKPKSFAGVFAAAPSLALVTIALTIPKEDMAYIVVEARSMLAGAVGFAVYASVSSHVLMRYRVSAPVVAFSFLLIWFAVSFSLWEMVLK
jgi:hypothetical protein